ncbi:hypothetical protein [Kitasatospora sp. NPDC097643]|uniref:hypothetical protein n=1 Tax=Kitasatospora sp. NPDC097643 TaxID=3157230 RepID=UPI00331E6947
MNRLPVAPDDVRVREYTEQQVATLLGELRRRGRAYGLLWGSAGVSGATIEGRLLVDFGNAPVSTLLNLLHLLRDAERNEAWE